MIKHFYLQQFNLAYVNKVKGFHELLCITNNSIKHQSFVSTQLNDQTVLFLAIKFTSSHFFAHSLKCQTDLFDP